MLILIFSPPKYHSLFVTLVTITPEIILNKILENLFSDEIHNIVAIAFILGMIDFIQK